MQRVNSGLLRVIAIQLLPFSEVSANFPFYLGYIGEYDGCYPQQVLHGNQVDPDYSNVAFLLSDPLCVKPKDLGIRNDLYINPTNQAIYQWKDGRISMGNLDDFRKNQIHLAYFPAGHLLKNRDGK